MDPQSELIQVAGVRDARELRMLCALRVPLVGFPLQLDTHAPDLAEAEAAQLIAGMPVTSRAVLITYAREAGEVAGLADDLGVACVQIHGSMSAAELALLREQRPDLFLIRSLVVGDGNEQDLRELIGATQNVVDAYITDTFDPETGASGATGRVHDWSVSRKLVDVSPRPVILAGGLTPDNVGDAIRAVRPAGVDAHTGLEDRGGYKDPEKVKTFLQRARAAL